jgi:flagellar biosynthetic protein FliQ
MDQGKIVDIAQEALKVVLYVSAPILLISLIVGLVISIFQATTQIQEQTLAFVPKLVAVIAAIAVFGAWIMKVLIEYTDGLMLNLNTLIK